MKLSLKFEAFCGNSDKERTMNNFTKHYIVTICLIVSMISASGIAYGQNYGGMVPSESVPAMANKDQTADGYSDVSLIPIDPDKEFTADDANFLLNYVHEASNYTLGKEDVIEITVIRHPEVSGEFFINNEGKIQYEFIGDITVEGLKKEEVKKLLTEKLSEYIISPDVTVQIIGYNSKTVYVVGEVGRPGKIFMRGDTITVREALVEAGLPLLTAKASKSHLITPSEDGKPEDKSVNVHDLLYKGDLRENLVMKPGDVLYVPPTFLAKTMRAIQPVSAPVNEAAGVGRRVYTGGF